MDAHDLPEHERIATHSVGEGLDFACNLLTQALCLDARTRPEAAPELLGLLANYVSFRYAGEDELALSNLTSLAHAVRDSTEVRWNQFWPQMEWIARQMRIPVEQLHIG